ncbi:MAG: ACP S-malonyltransferase, partial [Desulfobacterales bacterium]
MKKIAFLFPGQGAQAVGMGHDFYEEFELVREVFDMAEEITRMNLSRLCFNGPMEDLTVTANLQPAITAVNLAFLAVIEKEGLHPNIVAGHSLGEYSALSASGALTREDTFDLVKNRGELMHRESARYEGAMHAIVGLPIGTVEQLVAEGQKEGVVAVGNHNAELQIVITGAPDPVAKVSEEAVALGAKAIPLKVSGAWHSELIRGAEDALNAQLNTLSFKTPDTPIILNVTAEMTGEADEIRTAMTRQLCSPVKWYDTMGCLMDEA